jgi:hypothetical protein
MWVRTMSYQCPRVSTAHTHTHSPTRTHAETVVTRLPSNTRVAWRAVQRSHPRPTHRRSKPSAVFVSLDCVSPLSAVTEVTTHPPAVAACSGAMHGGVVGVALRHSPRRCQCPQRVRRLGHLSGKTAPRLLPSSADEGTSADDEGWMREKSSSSGDVLWAV